MGAYPIIRATFMKIEQISQHKIKNLTNLQVNDDDKHNKGGNDVHKIGQVLSHESSSQDKHVVLF